MPSGRNGLYMSGTAIPLVSMRLVHPPTQPGKRLVLAAGQVWHPIYEGGRRGLPREIVEVGEDEAVGEYVVWQERPDGKKARTQRMAFTNWLKKRQALLEIAD